MKVSRKDFLTASLGVVVATLIAPGCEPDTGGNDAGNDTDGGTDGGDTLPGNCSENGARGEISANHGHVLTVSRADVTAGAERTYSIQGGAFHSHMVTISAAQFAQLATNASISTTSSEAVGHSHPVTVVCA